MSDLRIRKLLVCNRGEIAIRIFRACTELNISTVAMYSFEDRFSLHRYKADESYQSGRAGSPVQSYLDIDLILQIAKRSGADAIHPGYGFLSEREELAKAVTDAGLTFIGPSSETLRIAGDKVETKALAKKASVPILPGSQDVETFEQASKAVSLCGYPIMLKAAHGGGGRGMRKVFEASELESAFESAKAEATSAFGKGDIFIEKLVDNPKHIEIQLLGDGSGDVIHLFERDCSLQRRHQKVIEFAPAIALDEAVKERLYEYAVALGEKLSLRSAATAEFLVSENGDIVFIEINPRIQVEHTVTEEYTGVDIVQAQLKIAAGASLSSLNLEQGKIRRNGVAIQCRITTENPDDNFQPEYGKLLAYRSASGFGIRLDAGSAFTGAEITPFYDSMLVKVTARASCMRDAAARMRRALREFRIRGVATNISFLENALKHPTFLSGEVRTSFLDETPEVFDIPKPRDRANKILRFIGEVSVNGHESMSGIVKPSSFRIPDTEVLFSEIDSLETVEDSWRNDFYSLGRDAFLKKVRDENKLLLCDTTWRDAHQSLLATRVRTFDIERVANRLSKAAPSLFSIEMWGGATFDVMLRFLKENPWERLERLREAAPNILFQMLLRGANGVGYKSYPDNVIKRFIEESHASGIDIFRIFDSLNNVERMKNAIDATRSSGALAEVCVCYTGDILEAARRKDSGEQSKYELEYYVNLVQRLESAGADIIAIKDMAGLLRPYAAHKLVTALKEETKLPIHFHTHDTGGAQSASILKASEAGVDIVDVAMASMSGVTSQPCLEGIVASLQNTPRDTGLTLDRLTPFSSYWDAVRSFYKPFESDLKSATGEVYYNEIPGGQYSNFRPQAESLGLGDKWTELKEVYAEVNQLFGDIIKVTPSSKVVGDMAIFMTSNGLRKEDVIARAETLDFPASVIEFFKGEIGIPEGGFPKELQQKILRGAKQYELGVADRLPDADFESAVAQVSEMISTEAGVKDALSYLLYPHVYKQYAESVKAHGNLIKLPSLPFFYGLEEGEGTVIDIDKGKRLYIELIAISDPVENGERTIFFELNGQPRSIVVRDRSIAPEEIGNIKAEQSNPLHIASPLAGLLIGLQVAEGEQVEQDQPLFTLEAMKMQSVVRATASGLVAKIHIEEGERIESGDLVMEFEGND